MLVTQTSFHGKTGLRWYCKMSADLRLFLTMQCQHLPSCPLLHCSSGERCEVKKVILPRFYFFALLFTSHLSPLSECLEQATVNSCSRCNLLLYNISFAFPKLMLCKYPFMSYIFLNIGSLLTLCFIHQTGLAENVDEVIKEYKETRGLLV